MEPWLKRSIFATILTFCSVFFVGGCSFSVFAKGEPDFTVKVNNGKIDFYRPGYFKGKTRSYLAYVNTINLWDASKVEFKYPLDGQECASYKGRGCQFTGSTTVEMKDLQSGAYVFKLTVREKEFLGFVVIPPREPKAKVAIIYPDFTFQAYNKAGKHNLYSVNKKKAPTRVNFLRPSISNGWYHDPNRMSIEKFLDEELMQLPYDVHSNLTVHQKPETLLNYDLVILFGHDEYWSPEYTQSIRKFLEKGGNLLNLSGNTAWWKTIVVGDELIVDKRPGSENAEGCQGNWYKCEPEEAIIGMSWKYAGYPIARKFKTRNALVKAKPPEELLSLTMNELNGIEIVAPKHKIFNGLDAKINRLGMNNGILSIEFDGLPLTADGLPDYLEAPDLPKGIKVLGKAWAYRTEFNHVGIMADFKYNSRSRVLSFGSVGWIIAINKHDSAVKKVTKNAINLLL